MDEYLSQYLHEKSHVNATFEDENILVFPRTKND